MIEEIKKTELAEAPKPATKKGSPPGKTKKEKFEWVIKKIYKSKRMPPRVFAGSVIYNIAIAVF